MAGENHRTDVLASGLVWLEPIAEQQLRAILAGAPEADRPWERGFPAAPLLDFLRRAEGNAELLGRFFAYVIVRVSDGKAVGDAGFHGPPGADGEVEIGYALVPDARGSGLAGEAVRLLIDWAAAQPGVKRIIARVDEGNEHAGRSEHLLRRLGFVSDGTRDGMRRFVLR